jgi:hypothetical protein
MKILIIIVAVIAFIAGLAGKPDGNVTTGVLYAVIAIIALLMLKAVLKKGTWQCKNCATILYNCPRPSPNGCPAGGQHLWNKVN